MLVIHTEFVFYVENSFQPPLWVGRLIPSRMEPKFHSNRGANAFDNRPSRALKIVVGRCEFKHQTICHTLSVFPISRCVRRCLCVQVLATSLIICARYITLLFSVLVLLTDWNGS